jgi:hypothetical protein
MTWTWPPELPLYLGNRNTYVFEALPDSTGNLLAGALLKFRVRDWKTGIDVAGPTWPLDATEDPQSPGDFSITLDAPELTGIARGDRLQGVLYRDESGALEPIQFVVQLLVTERSPT